MLPPTKPWSTYTPVKKAHDGESKVKKKNPLRPVFELSVKSNFSGSSSSLFLGKKTRCGEGWQGYGWLPVRKALQLFKPQEGGTLAREEKKGEIM